MIETLLTSSILIAFIFFARLLLKNKISRTFRYSLWILVALRLLIPFSLSASVSVMNILDTSQAEQFIYGNNAQIIESGNKNILQDISNADALTANSKQLQVYDYVKIIWICGSASVAIWFIISNAVFKMRLNKSRKRFDAPECTVPVYIVNDIQSPCLFGFFRPAIYITDNISLDKQTLTHVLTHESCHYRHFDHIWSFIRILCVSVYWFNPLVWMAAICSKSDCEQACDESAVKIIGENQKIEYGKTLVKLVQNKLSLSSFSCTATTMSQDSRSIKNRIKMIVKSPKTMISTLVAVIASLTIIVGCTFTGASKLTAEQAADELEKSLTYNEGSITFTIPADYVNSKDYNIMVYGSALMGNSEMSVHLFEEENADRTWIAGKTYTIDTLDKGYSELNMSIFMDSDSGIEKEISLIKSEKPIYNDAMIEFSVQSYYNNVSNLPLGLAETAPFTASFILPDGWELKRLNEPQDNIISGHFYCVMSIYNGDQYIGFIGFNQFEPYMEEINDEDYYKTVYPDLRLSSMYIWEPYTRIKFNDYSETGIAEIIYSDAKDLETKTNGESKKHETQGILSYNKNLGVYIGIQFAENSAATDEQILTIAESISLEAK